MACDVEDPRLFVDNINEVRVGGHLADKTDLLGRLSHSLLDYLNLVSKANG